MMACKKDREGCMQKSQGGLGNSGIEALFFGLQDVKYKKMRTSSIMCVYRYWICRGLKRW